MRKSLPLHALRTFEAVAYHHSFAKAAEELNVTPTAVSHQIKKLEELIGSPLFRRLPRPIALTDVGESLYPVLKESFDEIAMALEKLDGRECSRALVISTTTAFASRWLLPRLNVLKEQTGVELEIRASEICANLRDGDVDCAVRYTRKKIENYQAQFLAKDRYIPVASLEYAEATEQKSWAEKDLIQFHWKNASIDPPDWKKYMAALEKAGVDTQGVDITKAMRFSEESHAIESAVAGHGVALVSDVLIKKEIKEGRLVQIGDVSIEGLSFYVVYQNDAPRQSLIEEFLLWARDEIMDVDDTLAQL